MQKRSRADCPLLLFIYKKEYGKTRKKQRNAVPCFFLVMAAESRRKRFLFYISEREGFIMTDIQFDYFTAAETEQYTFYRIPKALFTESHFQALSCEAKVLYGMMLDRLGLSIRNQWFDSQGRAYIIFTVEDVMGVMGCQSQKAVRLMKELDTADGIGLIEKKRIGLGRPNRIYVKNFMVRRNGGSENGTGGAYRIQALEADIPRSPGLSGKKAAEPEGRPGFVRKMPEVNADAENTAVSVAAVMPETQEGQDQNWWMCGESIPENEGYGITDASICREENGAHEENWWDMETDVPSGAEIPGGGKPLCKSAAGTVPGIESDADIVDKVDIVDNSHMAANSMDEYQNSGRGACFSLEMQAPEKGYGYRNGRTQLVPAAWEGLQNPYSGSSRQETSGQETGFADKTVEAMVRELLWKQKPGPHCRAMECSREPEMQACERQDSVIVETETPKQRDSKRNDTECSETEYSKTEKNKTDFSAVCQSNQSYQPCTSSQYIQGGQQDGIHPDSGMDGAGEKIDTYRECIRENIDYQCFRAQDMESVDELVELMADTMLVPDRGTVRVAGTEKPAPVVKGRFMKLAHSHIEYVIGCMQKHTGKIRNIKAYLLTALYNSSLTISSYYRAEVNHDLYGLYGCC